MSTRSRLVALAGAAALAAACGGPSPSSDPTPPAAQTATASTEAPLPATASASGAAVDPGLTGQQVVEQVCSQCHSMEPPPLAAPPLTHLARHLRESFGTVDEAVAHVLAYAPAPDQERSILPAQAIERFGLMPPQPLPEPLLDAAARYIWSLADDAEAGSGMGGGMQMRQGEPGERGMGMGMQMRHQQADSTRRGGMQMRHPQGDSTRGGGMGMQMRRNQPDGAGMAMPMNRGRSGNPAVNTAGPGIGHRCGGGAGGPLS